MSPNEPNETPLPNSLVELDRQIEALRLRRQKYLRRVTALQARRDRLREALQAAETALAKATSGLDAVDDAGTKSLSRVDRVTQPALHTVLASILAETGPATIRELADGLASRGYITDAAKPRAAVYQAMYTRPDVFSRDADTGRYYLTPPGAAVAPSKQPYHSDPEQQTLRDMLVDALLVLPGRAATAERLATAVLAVGYKTRAKRFITTVKQVLRTTKQLFAYDTTTGLWGFRDPQKGEEYVQANTTQPGGSEPGHADAAAPAG